jgi:hypothetical protein
MRWSKLRSLVRENFAPSVGARLDIHSAAYGACTCGHAWLTFDGEVIANFCTRAAANTRGHSPPSDEINPMYRHQLAAYGELSRQDAYQACWAFVHELSIEQALKDEDPLIQSLAMVDRRLGKRRLQKIAKDGLHPLALKLLEARLESEGLTDSVFVLA